MTWRDFRTLPMVHHSQLAGNLTFTTTIEHTQENIHIKHTTSVFTIDNSLPIGKVRMVLACWSLFSALTSQPTPLPNQEGEFTGAGGATSTMMTSVDDEGRVVIKGPFPKDKTKTMTEKHALSADGQELVTTMRLQDSEGKELAFVTRVYTKAS